MSPVWQVRGAMNTQMLQLDEQLKEAIMAREAAETERVR